jgi:modulator of FtsH protease HflC
MVHAHPHSTHGHYQRPDASGYGPVGPAPSRWKFGARLVAAIMCIALGAAAASLLAVHSGEAVVITRFGEPVRIMTEPGLAWRWPGPIEASIPVDLRLHTTSSGLQDVGTKDGLRVIVQAYAAWQVGATAGDIGLFVRSVGNRPEEAAAQLRSLLGSALQTTAADFDLAALVNTDPRQVKLDQFESELRYRLDQQFHAAYGVRISQTGIERLTLPSATLAATVERMRAERETIAAQRTAEGKQQAAQIRYDAERDARILIADANVRAADIEAQSRQAAAVVYGKSYASDPRLYTMLRSLDTLNSIVNANTNLILRTDAAPFRVLTHGPGEPEGPVRPGRR